MISKEYLLEMLPSIMLGDTPVFVNMEKQLLTSDGYDGIITLISNMQGAEFPCVILEEESQGYFDIFPGGLDANTITLWVMDNLGRNSRPADTFIKMKAVLLKIIGKLLVDAQAEKITGLQLDRMPYNRINGGNGCYGYTLLLTFNDEIEL